MPKTSILTIGIPTYNRLTHVDRLIANLAEFPCEGIEILVIDDGGVNGAFDILTEKYRARKSLRILRNEINIGYAATLVKIFKECQTDYLMMMADDDLVALDHLPTIQDFLLQYFPDFISPQFMVGQSVYRGSINTRPIKPEEFFSASAHAPGLIYKVSACKSGIDALARRIELKSAEGLVYPQIVLLTSLIAEGGRCYWLATPSAIEGSAEPSGIRDQQGRVYWSFESRWQQLMGFDDLLNGLLPGALKSDCVRKMIAANATRGFGHLLDAMQSDNPALRAAFDRRGRVFYVKQWIKLAMSVLLPKRISARLLGSGN